MGYTGGLHIHNKTHSYLALLVHMDQKAKYAQSFVSVSLIEKHIPLFGCLKFKFKFAGFLILYF